MAKQYHPPRTPVLELYVQIHQDPETGRLAIEIAKTLGLMERMSCYKDKCDAPVASAILQEVESCFTELLENEVLNRWGIQQTAIEFFPS